MPSLVGSEMCIRDSAARVHRRLPAGPRESLVRQPSPWERGRRREAAGSLEQRRMIMVVEEAARDSAELQTAIVKLVSPRSRTAAAAAAPVPSGDVLLFAMTCVPRWRVVACGRVVAMYRFWIFWQVLPGKFCPRETVLLFVNRSPHVSRTVRSSIQSILTVP